MKKVLFATTALVATAGMAAAQSNVTLGGYGRFGLFYQENATGTNETRIEQRLRLTITGQTVADNGLEFEGRIRFQTDENGAGASGVAKSSAAGFAVSTGGFRMDVGSVSNVIDSGDVVEYFGYGVGLTSSIEQSNGFGNTATGFGTKGSDQDTVAPTVKLRYSVGDFTVSASVTDDAATQTLNAATPALVAGGGNGSYQLGASYSFGNDWEGWVQLEDLGDDDDTSVYQFGVNYYQAAQDAKWYAAYVMTDSNNRAIDYDKVVLGYSVSVGRP